MGVAWFAAPARAHLCAQGTAFSTMAPLDIFNPGRMVEVGDLNGDMVPDLVFTDRFSFWIKYGIPLANGDISYSFPGDAIGVGNSPTGIAVADLEQGGFQEIVVARAGTPGADNTLGVVILRRNESGGFTILQSLPSGPAWQVRTHDVTGDGFLDLVVTRPTGLIVYRGLSSGGVPTGTFQSHYSIYSVGDPRAFALADLDGDGLADAAVATGTNAIAVHRGLANGGFETPLAIPVGGATSDVAAGDLDGDGHLDLAVSTSTGNTVSVLIGTTGLSFLPPVAHSVSAPTSVRIADLDGDDLPDIAAATGTGVVAILWNLGTGFSTPESYAATSGNGLAVADLNGDGGLDIAIAPQDSLARVLINRCDVPNLVLSTPIVGPGSVVRVPNQLKFRSGDAVTLDPVPSPRARFDHWSGDTLATADPLQFTMSTSVQYSAHFVWDMKRLSVTIDGMGQVETDPPDTTILVGTAVGAYATAAPGHRFIGWTGSVESDSALIHFQMDSDLSLVAHFELDPATADVNARPPAWSLTPVIPNPGRGDFHFQFGSPTHVHANLAILDASGRRVRVLFDGAPSAGWRTVTWDGRDESRRRAAPGRYWVRLQAEGRTITRELTLLR